MRQRSTNFRPHAAALSLAAVLLILPGVASSQTPAADPLYVPARQWAAEASLNELKVVNFGSAYLRYRMHTRDSKGDRVRDVIESKDGTVARLILKDGRPLTPDEDAGERERLQAMLDSPSAFARHVKNDASGKRLAAELIRQLPDAMLFNYAPGQPQRSNRPASSDNSAEIVIDFAPNPAWNPPTITADALTGIQGRAWIDPKTHYMTRIEGTLFRGVNLAGFVAHIYEGGHLAFEQTRASEQRWIFTSFIEHVDVRVLVKKVKEDTEIESSNFTSVPAISYQEAIRLLLSSPLPSH